MADILATHYEQTKRSLDARFQCTGYAERTWKASSQRRVRWTFEPYATRDGAIVLWTVRQKDGTASEHVTFFDVLVPLSTTNLKADFDEKLRHLTGGEPRIPCNTKETE